MSLETTNPAPRPATPNVNGVIAGRTVAFFVDLIFISLIWGLLSFVRVIPLGLLTAGLIWFWCRLYFRSWLCFTTASPLAAANKRRRACACSG